MEANLYVGERSRNSPLPMTLSVCSPSLIDHTRRGQSSQIVMWRRTCISLDGYAFTWKFLVGGKGWGGVCHYQPLAKPPAQEAGLSTWRRSCWRLCLISVFKRDFQAEAVADVIASLLPLCNIRISLKRRQKFSSELRSGSPRSDRALSTRLLGQPDLRVG